MPMPAQSHDVVVVGSVNADLVVRVDRWPAPGETVLGSDLETHPGGKGANQAVAAARLGARVGILGRIGADRYGEFLAERLRHDGIDTEHLLTTPVPTGVALISVGPGGENSIIVSPGANRRLSEEDVAAARPLLGSARVISLQLEIPMPTVLAAARAAAETGARVVLNLSPATRVPPELLRLCDPLVVNEHEAAFVLGSTRVSAQGSAPAFTPDGAVSAAGLATALLALGPRSVVITLGARGAVVARGTEIATVPSPEVEPADTTGAGDAFTGALCRRLAGGDGLVAAARFAARVGAAAVRKAGAQTSFPTLEELAET
ncbi:ribokinase [Actinomadura sp. HBU206391]|uniref:ribokinase n=1 Tax=Actinomadura sp. HBU206391 TaxID=2731692 RepID=UPI001650A559|nr:ribokinase [Actinomadura sp. HBU206391]MBC6458345.1 ribokinase [Actinomadura sp. HBU206391]